MTFPPGLFDLPDTCGPVRFEKNREYFRHEIVELFACHGIRELHAFGACRDVFFLAAHPYFTPRCLVVAGASAAAFFEIRAASPAKKAAIGNEIGIRSDLTHE
jgi:hypothetical protein